MQEQDVRVLRIEIELVGDVEDHLSLLLSRAWRQAEVGEEGPSDVGAAGCRDAERRRSVGNRKMPLLMLAAKTSSDRNR